MTYKNPKGGSAVAVIVTVIVVVVGGLTGGLGLVGLNAIDCHINLFWGCGDSGGGGGSGGGNGAQPASLCTSNPNACGETNTGTLSSCSSGDTCVGGETCSATVPPNSSCPAPGIAAGSFYATPATVGTGNSSMLTWSASNSTTCTITSNNGFTPYTGSSSGSVSTGPITQSGTYTLTCSDGDGGPSTSSSVNVIVDPHYQEI